MHTTTHAMFVDEPRAGNGEANRGGRRAPLAQQEFEVGRFPSSFLASRASLGL